MIYTATAALADASPHAAHNLQAEALIARHMPLVRRLAWHVHGRMASSVELEELIQTGMVALIEAARAFEDRGFAFATYASTRIKGSMIDQLRRSSRQTRSAAANRRAIENARRRLENSLCRQASAAEIAAEMGMELETFHTMQHACENAVEVDLDSVYSDEDSAFCDPERTGEEAIDGQSSRAALGVAIAALPPREQMVLQLYFFEELNLEEIGQTLDIGASRVCQIKKSALDKLRDTLGPAFEAQLAA
jgi:RNA polymerase sigma factor FliA